MKLVKVRVYHDVEVEVPDDVELDEFFDYIWDNPDVEDGLKMVDDVDYQVLEFDGKFVEEE